MNELSQSDLSQYQTTCLSFINALIISATSLEESGRIRNEFLGSLVFSSQNIFIFPLIF